MRHRKQFRPSFQGQLEERVVPSGLLGRFTSEVFSLRGGFGREGGPSSFGGRDRGSIGSPSGQGGSASLLKQDARAVQQAFQALSNSVQSAVSALCQTATSTSGPTQAGLDAYNASIQAAISTLDGSIASALSNLPTTGAGLLDTITGYTATLESQLKSAGVGLENSTSSAVLSTNREARTYIKAASGQAVNAILGAQPTAGLTSSAVQAYNQAANSAYQAFNLAVSNALQDSLSDGAALDPSAVSAAIDTLQGSLDAAITGLGTGFSGSSFNPTAAIATELANLETDLLAIAAPTPGNRSSNRLFTRSVSSTIARSTGAINQAVSTAIQGYNNSLL